MSEQWTDEHLAEALNRAHEGEKRMSNTQRVVIFPDGVKTVRVTPHSLRPGWHMYRNRSENWVLAPYRGALYAVATRDDQIPASATDDEVAALIDENRRKQMDPEQLYLQVDWGLAEFFGERDELEKLEADRVRRRKEMREQRDAERLAREKERVAREADWHAQQLATVKQKLISGEKVTGFDLLLVAADQGVDVHLSTQRWLRNTMRWIDRWVVSRHGTGPVPLSIRSLYNTLRDAVREEAK